MGAAIRRTPAHRATTLLADGWLRVSDVRCLRHPPPTSRDEVAPALTFAIPLDGAFVREVLGGRRSREVLGVPTQALVYRPGEASRVRHPLGGGDRSLAVGLSAPAVEALGIRPADLPDAVATSVALDLLVRRAFAERGDGCIDPLAAAEDALAVVGALARVAARRVPDRAGDRAPDAVVDAVRLTLAADLAARWTLPAIGRAVGRSPFQLARRFRAATGLTIHGYRTSLRVRRALERIAAGERDLTTLALDLGFAHHSHLTTTIRRQTGRPPSAYRQPPTPRELAILRTIVQAEAVSTA